MDKGEWRRTLRARRAELTAEQREWAEGLMVQHVQAFFRDRLPQRVLAYAAVAPEASTTRLIEALWGAGGTVCLPRLHKDRPGYMEAVPFSAWDELVPGPHFGILQSPEDASAVDPAGMDAIVVPGVGFDRKGRRLGQAGGYYDRLLARLPKRIVRIGWAFAAQLVDELPEEPHDERVDVLVTERGSLRFEPEAR